MKSDTISFLKCRYCSKMFACVHAAEQHTHWGVPQDFVVATFSAADHKQEGALNKR